MTGSPTHLVTRLEPALGTAGAIQGGCKSRQVKRFELDIVSALSGATGRTQVRVAE